MIKSVKNVFSLLVPAIILLLIFSPCTAMDEEPKHFAVTLKTTRKQENIADFPLPSRYSRLLYEIHQKEDQLKNTNTYFSLSISHSLLSICYNSEDVLYRFIFLSIPLLKKYITPILPEKTQPFFQIALNEVNDQLDALRFCQHTKPYIAEKILGYSSLLLMNVLPSDESYFLAYREEIEAAIYYFSKTAGWYGADDIQSCLTSLWDKWGSDRLEGYNWGSFFVSAGEISQEGLEECPISLYQSCQIPQPLETCSLPAAETQHPLQEDHSLVCKRPFSTQKDLNHCVAKIAHFLYNSINAQWDYPSEEQRNLDIPFSTQSSFWKFSSNVTSKGKSWALQLTEEGQQNPARSLRDILNKFTIADCYFSQKLVVYKVLNELLGDDNFNNCVKEYSINNQVPLFVIKVDDPLEGQLIAPFINIQYKDSIINGDVGHFGTMRNVPLYSFFHEKGLYFAYNVLVAAKEEGQNLYTAFGKEFLGQNLNFAKIGKIFKEDFFDQLDVGAFNKSKIAKKVPFDIIEEIIEDYRDNFTNSLLEAQDDPPSFYYYFDLRKIYPFRIAN